jgi:hypothetical protein
MPNPISHLLSLAAGHKPVAAVERNEARSQSPGPYFLVESILGIITAWKGKSGCRPWQGLTAYCRKNVPETKDVSGIRVKWLTPLKFHPRGGMKFFTRLI